MENETIKTAAENFEERIKTKNIADLERFDVNMELNTYEGTNSDGEKFSYKYVTDKEGIRYRVPYPVIAQIKDYREENPEQTLFKAKQSGTGLQTRYTVIAINQ